MAGEQIGMKQGQLDRTTYTYDTSRPQVSTPMSSSSVIELIACMRITGQRAASHRTPQRS